MDLWGLGYNWIAGYKQLGSVLFGTRHNSVGSERGIAGLVWHTMRRSELTTVYLQTNNHDMNYF